MQNRKRIFSVLLLVGVLLVLSGVIGHLSPMTTAEEAVKAPIATPILVDNPYLIADIAEMASPATVFLSVEWPVVEETPSPRSRSMTTDPFYNFFFDY